MLVVLVTCIHSDGNTPQLRCVLLGISYLNKLIKTYWTDCQKTWHNFGNNFASNK